MDIQAVAEQLVSTLGDNPDLLKQFGADPQKTAHELTGSHLTASQLGSVLELAGPLLSGKTIDLSHVDLGALATLAASLLGAGDTEPATKSSRKSASGVDLSDGLDLGDVMGLAGDLLGKDAPAKKTAKRHKKQSVDLGDGLDLGDVMGLAGEFLGGDAEAASAKKPIKEATRKSATKSTKKGTGKTTKSGARIVKKTKTSNGMDTGELIEGALGALGSILGGK